MAFLPYAIAAWLFIVGLYGLVTSRHMVHLVISLSVVQSSTYIVLLGVGYQHGGQAPLFPDLPPVATAVDPVVHALALVDVVVEATVMALLLALAVQAQKRFHTVDPDELAELRG
jgi:multicomponent Na+:H+ antiporter subunit C